LERNPHGEKLSLHLDQIAASLESTKADALRWTILFASKVIHETAAGRRSLLLVDNAGKDAPMDITPILP
jgi:hypothetical protein